MHSKGQITSKANCQDMNLFLNTLKKGLIGSTVKYNKTTIYSSGWTGLYFITDVRLNTAGQDFFSKID